MDHFTPTADPVLNSVAVSALVGLLPLLTFFILLAVVKTKAYVAGAFSLLVAVLVASLGFGMPVVLAGLSATQGAVFGAYPVLWIVIMAVWLYQVTVLSGRFDDLRRVFDQIGGGDIRIQSILIAFCFGGLLEALAGFGAPVAITATMLLALGMKPLKAAAAVLVANTAPVAFRSRRRLGVDVPGWLAARDIKIPWPVLHDALVDSHGEPLGSTVYNFQWLSSPGTLLLLTGLIVALVYAKWDNGGRFRLRFRDAVREIGSVIYKMRGAALTIMLVLALAYVMNNSGQTVAIGVWLAGTGGLFAFLSPTLGWFGTAVTGSDTSSNALFAKLQQTAGLNAGIDPNLLVAANTTGGVVGKLIGLQNLAIAATAVDMDGQESVIFRKVVGWSAAMLVFLCILVFLQSTPVLGWMLP